MLGHVNILTMLLEVTGLSDWLVNNYILGENSLYTTLWRLLVSNYSGCQRTSAHAVSGICFVSRQKTKIIIFLYY